MPGSALQYPTSSDQSPIGPWLVNQLAAPAATIVPNIPLADSVMDLLRMRFKLATSRTGAASDFVDLYRTPNTTDANYHWQNVGANNSSAQSNEGNNRGACLVATADSTGVWCEGEIVCYNFGDTSKPKTFECKSTLYTAASTCIVRECTFREITAGGGTSLLDAILSGGLTFGILSGSGSFIAGSYILARREA